jgi:hypothetical protein
MLSLLTATAAGVTPAATAAAGARPGGPASLFTMSGSLSGVAAVSARDAWAVGSTGAGTLIVHWNGRAWKRVRSPSPARTSSLSGVAAVSARDAWAVGSTGRPTSPKTLILHWDGRAWKRVPSPGGSLSGVAATSGRNAWAVGSTGILHWNGRTWKRVPSPAGFPSSVAATSARNAWAVGSTGSLTSPATLILRWNGKSWKRAPSPGAGKHFLPFLRGVAATSARRAWAVGSSTDCGCGAGLSMTLRWDGRTWKRVHSPTPGGGTNLYSVAVTSARRAWAVGLTGEGTSPPRTLILRWNGSSWTKVPSPAPGADSGLSGVAATSAGRAWAVGSDRNSSKAKDQTLILGWNGRTWK